MLIAAAGLVLFEFVWFAVNWSAPVGPPLLGMLPVLTLSVLTVAGFWRASRMAGISQAAARFWRTLVVGGSVSTFSQLIELPAYSRGPVAPENAIGTILSVFVLVLVLVTLYRLPLGIASRAERFRLSLDVATVTIAAVLFAWYFAYARVADSATESQARNIVLTCASIAVGVLALVKVIMSGSRTIDPIVLRLFGIALCAEAIGIMATPLLGGREQVATEPLGRAVMYVCLVGATVRQWRLATSAAEPGIAVRRPFSVLPYLAIACVDALLLTVLADHGIIIVVVTVTAVAMTFLVIVRQLAAFRDNSRLLNELASQERRFRSLVQNAADAIVICEPDGRLTYVSPALERITGLPASTWLDNAHFDVVHPDDALAVRENFEAAVTAPGLSRRVQARITHANDGWRWIEINFTNLLDDPAVAGIVFNITDITEARQFHQQLSYQASHDSLTDLANRSLFGEQLQVALQQREGHDIWLVLIDLDDFKSVNDTLGHQAGDALLIAVAERLRRAVRPQDLVARLGGDEFAILLGPVTNDRVDSVVERMLSALAEPITISDRELTTHASIGIAAAHPGENPTELIRHADIAMYQAKAAGKGQYARYTQDMDPVHAH